MGVKSYLKKMLIKILEKFILSEIDILEKKILNNENIEFFNLIEKKNFNIYIENKLNENLWHLSVKHNNFEVLIMLLKKLENKEILEFKNIYGDTPLIQAAINGNFKIVKYLIEQCSCNYNSKEFNGFNIFLIACGNGSTSIIQYININYPNLVESKLRNKQNGFHRAAFYNKNEIIKFLFENTTKIKIYSKDKDGNTPMHLAAFNFNISTCRLIYNLVENSKININMYNLKNKDNLTPIDIIKNQIKRIKEYEEKRNIYISDNKILEYLNNKDSNVFELSQKTKKIINKVN